ncbi:MAG TPA: NAD(P)-dependent oxidoreductase [Steroidobacteraceae bacterium]|nr:NAD(P)-dependent oxidoreductase [Steroidobacteraceae bacterium]
MQRVAVTGASGVIGRRLCPDLSQSYEIVRLDRADADINLDITDLARLKGALAGCQAVIHLAASVSPQSPWQDVERNNIDGTYKVFEAARQAGCQRVIFASSHHVVGMYNKMPHPAADGESRAPLGADLPPRPDSLYAVSKVFGEALGRYYSDNFGMRVACIRIGAVTETDSPVPRRSMLPWKRDAAAEKRMAAKWLSHRDLAGLIRAVLASDVSFAVVYAVGDNKGRFLDLAPAREIFGHFPLDGSR